MLVMREWRMKERRVAGDYLYDNYILYMRVFFLERKYMS